MQGDENMTKQHWKEEKDYLMLVLRDCTEMVLVREPLSNKREFCLHMCSVNFETFENRKQN